MKVQSNWQKIYNEPREGEFLHSLIALRKVPYLMSFDEQTERSTCVQFQKRLYLDLWIVKLHIDWLTARSDQPNKLKRVYASAKTWYTDKTKEAHEKIKNSFSR